MSPHSAGGKTPDEWTAAYGKRPEAVIDLGYMSLHAELQQELEENVPRAVTACGIDPGPVPGIFLALWRPGKRKAVEAHAYQCNASSVSAMVYWLLGDYGENGTLLGEIEEFRTGRGAGSRGGHASLTREMVSTLTALAAERGVKLAVRHSSQVMPWATDKRLEAAGILDATTGLVHARAASRHCLYAACHDGGLPDPLSRRTS